MAKRRTVSEIRALARAERDFEIAGFLDGYAKLVERRRADTADEELALAVRGLASSIRAGLVDEGMPG